MIGPGPVDIYYEATVNMNTTGVDPRTVWEFDFVELPMELLEFLWTRSPKTPLQTFSGNGQSPFFNCDLIFDPQPTSP